MGMGKRKTCGEAFMIRIRDISILPGQGGAELLRAAGNVLGIDVTEITELKIKRRSIDARKKNDLRVVYTVDVAITGDETSAIAHAAGKASSAEDQLYIQPMPKNSLEIRPVVVGFGPAGIFAALVLARAGLNPLVLERGLDVDTRTKKVHDFWSNGILDPECNVQFGEGGAGTFSDGKLNTGIKNERISFILESFHRAGADESILIDAKPHIGTDALRGVVKNLRQEIVALGGEIFFGKKLSGFSVKNGALCAISLSDGDVIPCEKLILAIGHSARDTFDMLNNCGLPMEPKAFSMGARIEHKQSVIDLAQYGMSAPDAGLPTADYKLSCHIPGGGSAYTFCMCPGGYVVAAASEEFGVVTNGMSEFLRDGENANSALLVTLTPDMFPDKSTLGGMYWQREIERRAFEAGGCNYHAPAQTVGDFLAGHSGSASGKVTPSYHPGVKWCDLHTVLPAVITRTMEKAIPAFGRKLRGFDDHDAILTAPETRSSSPVRIVRDTVSMQSAVGGVFPCGEGAGYAGGIISAAADGMRCAEALIESI